MIKKITFLGGDRMADNRVYTIVEHLFITPIWHARSIDGLKRAAAKQKRIIYEISSLDELDENNLPTAIILISTRTDWTTQIIAECKKRNIRPILIGNMPGKFGENISGTMYGNKATIEKLVNYFVNCGRTRLAMVGIYGTSSNDTAKRDAILSIAKSLNLPVTAEDIYYSSPGTLSPNELFFDKIDQYQGVLCSNDFVATNVLQYAQKRGISVPEKLYVAGLGDTIICRYTTPTLTSATRSYEETGEQAFNIWKQLSSNPRLSSIVVTVDCEIKPRGSTDNSPLPDSAPTACTEGPIMPTMAPGTMIEDIDKVRYLVNCLTQCNQLDMQIIQRVMEGKCMEDIAEELSISISTGRYRIKRIYAAANVSTKAEFLNLFKRYITNDKIFSDFEKGYSNIDENDMP